MKVLGFAAEVLVTAIAAGLASVAATSGWNLAAHGAPAADWITAVRLAILLGVGLPVARRAAAPRRCRPRVPPAGR
jgi:hypothetical protein